MKLLCIVHVMEPQILQKFLQKTDILVIHVTKHILFRQKQRDYWCLKQYKELKEQAALELKTLIIIRQHGRNLCRLLI